MRGASIIFSIFYFSTAVYSVALIQETESALVTRSAFENSVGIAPFPFDDTDDNLNTLTSAFDFIACIPDSVLNSGTDAVKSWAQQNGNRYVPGSVNSSKLLLIRQSWIAIGKCVLQIGLLLVEDGIPLARLRRLKELIKLIGGAKEVAKMLLKAKTLKQLYVIGGPYFKDLIEELTGLQGVISSCFNFHF